MTALFNFIVAFILAVIGFVLTILFARLIVIQLLPLLKALKITGRSRSRSINKAALRIKKADDYIKNNELKKAALELQKAFLVDLFSSKEVIFKLKEHHQNALSRCLLIAEEQNSRIKNIAELERLLSGRIDLQLLLIRAKESLEQFQNKRKQKGQKTPAWSTKEFSSKINSIQEELNKNRSDLNKALKTLFQTLLAKTPKKDIVYH